MKQKFKISYFDRRIKTPVKIHFFFINIKHFNKAKKKNTNKPKRITVNQFKLRIFVKKKQLSNVNGCFLKYMQLPCYL